MNKDLIVKDNRLITAKYHLTLTQIKFISFLTSKINRDDKDFFIYTFKINDILDVLEIQRTNYKSLRVSLRQLMTKYIIIEDNEDVISETTFLSHFKIDKKKDTIEIRFDSSLKPFFLELRARFTKLSLSKILKFNSQYTIRMYEIIESRVTVYDKYKNQNLLEFKYDLNEIKEILIGESNGKDAEIKVTYAGYRIYANDSEIHKNPRGEEHYWLGLHPLNFKPRDPKNGLSDYEAIRDGFISITPIMLDLTSYERMNSLQKWLF